MVSLVDAILSLKYATSVIRHFCTNTAWMKLERATWSSGQANHEAVSTLSLDLAVIHLPSSLLVVQPCPLGIG